MMWPKNSMFVAMNARAEQFLFVKIPVAEPGVAMRAMTLIGANAQAAAAMMNVANAGVMCITIDILLPPPPPPTKLAKAPEEHSPFQACLRSSSFRC